MNQTSYIQASKLFSIRDIIFYVLKKWKVLFVLFLIGAVLGSGYSYYKKNATTEANKIENRKAKLEKTLESGNTDVLDLERVVRYRSLKEAFETAVITEESDHRLLTSDEVWTITQTYYLTTTEGNVNGVRTFLTGILNRNDRLMNLYNEADTDWTYEEFVSTLNVNLKINDLPDNYVSSLDTVRDGTLTIRVWAEQEEDCRKYVEILNSYLSEADSYIREYYPDGYSLTLSSDTAIYGVSSIVTNLRKTLSDARSNAYNAFKDAESKLTDTEKMYYQIYYGNYKEKAGSFSKKWPVLGAMGMTLLGAFLYVFFYIVNGKLKNEEEIIFNYDQRVLAVLDSEKQTKDPVIKLLNNLEVHKRMQVNDKNYLGALLKISGVSSGIISGDREDKDIKDVVDFIASENTGFSAAGRLDKDADAVSMTKEADGIVFVVHFGKTKNIEFERELDIARVAGTPVVGVVAIK